MKHKLLIIDDDDLISYSLTEFLQGHDFEVYSAPDLYKGMQIFQEQSEIKTILLDIHLPDGSGIEALDRFKSISPEATIIMITAHSDVKQAVEAIKKGAFDYLAKPFLLDDLLIKLRNAIEKQLLKQQIHNLSNRFIHKNLEAIVWGNSEYISELRSHLHTISQNCFSTVLIQGETGTGKEIIAQYIHYHGARATKPFIEVNIAAIPFDLLESELFGHEAGAFTGANKAKKGLFELAHTGTLFLDEIGDMPLSMQAKILKAIEEKSIRRIGAEQVIPIDIRLIAATHKNLLEDVSKGLFRQDLYYRLSVIPIYLPPLRERKEDIQAFTEHFIRIFNREFGKKVENIDLIALKILQAHDWPGNIRELKNVIERSMLLRIAPSSSILRGEDLLMDSISRPNNFHVSMEILEARVRSIEEFPSLEELEKKHIQQVLSHCENNKQRTASILQIDRSTLYSKLKKHQIL